MNKIISKKAIIWICVFIGLALYTCITLSKEKVDISKISWKANNGQYVVSFHVKNKSQKQLDTKLRIMLRKRTYVGGSAKAEVFDIVGTKTIHITLDPVQSLALEEIVKPKSLAFKVDMVTINVL